MKITRKVNGISMEFDLDSQELFSAYEEQEHIWDVSYIEENFRKDERFNCMTDEERSTAYNDIAWSFRSTLNDMETPDQWEIACKELEEFFDDYIPKNIWITVYKDALGCPGHDDNLTEILVPIDWLKGVLEKDGITDFESWQDEYTADSTDNIARMALDEGVILKCNIVLGIDKDEKTVDKLLADATEKSQATLSNDFNKDLVEIKDFLKAIIRDEAFKGLNDVDRQFAERFTKQHINKLEYIIGKEEQNYEKE